MQVMFDISAMSGIAVQVREGQSIRIIDVMGEQVADLVAYRANDYSERFDPSVTMDALQVFKVAQGDVLYSNKYQSMFTIVDDKIACHDLLNSACRPEMYEFLYNKKNHRSCYENLNGALTKFGVPQPDQHYPFNIFMHTEITQNGKVTVKRPISKAGDSITLRAEMDLVVAVSACPCEESVVNGYKCTPLRLEIGETH